MESVKKTCSSCSKSFLIISQEQEFLKKMGLPLPQKCPTCRQLRRLSQRGERTLYRTKCQECHQEIIVSYNPEETTNTILCKNCYQKYIETTDLMRSEEEP